MTRSRARHCWSIIPLAILATSCSAAPQSAVAGNARRFSAPDDTAPAALLRFPDIHGDTVVFVYGEDLWSAPVAGGPATRLSFHDGAERFPRFSPDGQHIAFTGQYDGNGDVYVMDAAGGNIRRVTYHPGYDEVIGWHPTSGKILFRSGRSSYSRFQRLFTIDIDGTGIEELILNEAAIGSFSPDGKQIAYNRVARENRTWKRYRGGTAQDIYIYDFASDDLRNLTKHPGTDRFPMWIGNRVYFTSDRERRLNLYAIDPASGALEALTAHKAYDVRRPNHDDGRIVYELGGELWVVDVKTGQNRKIPITINHDAEETRPFLKKVGGEITDFGCSPSGARAVVVARGEVFTVPRKDGPTRNLTRDCGSRDRGAAWSPDGAWIAYVSDRDGEYNIYVIDPHAHNEPRQLTHYESGYRHTLTWSPDSTKIAFADHTLRCFILDVASGQVTEVDKADYENVDVALERKNIHDYTWSPDGRYLAYSKMNADLLYQVYVYALSDRQSHCVSTGQFNDFGPVFTHDGGHLVFVSNRRFDPTFCDFEWEMVYKKVAGLYALTLAADGGPLLPFKSDEEAPKPAETTEPDKTEDVVVRIDFDGLAERIEALPVARGNYRELSVATDAIYFLDSDEGDFNHFDYRALGPRTLKKLSLKDRETHTVLEDIEAYDMSADGTALAWRNGTKVGILDLATPASDKTERHALDVGDLAIWIEPHREWAQIYHEAWRLERDYYYDANLHGLDWSALGRQYGRLLPAMSCRQDVQFIIGELIGELNTSHTYIFGGDRQRTSAGVNVGMLGIDYMADGDRYRITKVYDTPDWTAEVHPPLARPGLVIKTGDFILRVNGAEITTARNFYSHFQNLANKQITLTVNGRPDMAGAREIIVKPLAGESTLRYLDWVEHNRRVAAEASDGQIGYLHFPDTYMGSAREFPKGYYGQTRRKGLIIDGRFNGGGLDPDIFLGRIDKQLLSLWTRRYSHDQTSPFVVTTAHLACLTNRQAGSGGDMLPMEFQMRGMGPVIGTRTWGGLVGVSMFIDLIDGGGLTAPDYRIYDTSGKWIVENEGVTPDIEVELHPAEIRRGHDAQLRKAIDVLLDSIKNDPRPWPQHEPFPIDR